MSDLPELTPVRERHRFDEGRLAEYLSQEIDPSFADLTVLQFEGGQSNPTFALDVKGKKYVLRKKPPGILLKSAHAVDREYRVISAIQDSGVPVPKTYLLCEDDEVIGTPFYVMEYVEGRVTQDAAMPSFSPEARAAIYSQFIEIIAAMHSVDLEASGLSDFGRPGNYYSRQISRWTKQYRASETDPIPEMDSLIEWLPEHTPDLTETTLVHGDYRVGNTLIHPTEPRIVAILDWELSTTGHPLADIGYSCMMYYAGRDPGSEPREPAPGIPSLPDFVARYCELMGREPVENWPFFIIYNLFRSAAIVQGVYKRGLDGNASSDQWKTRASNARASAERGWAMTRA